MKTKKILALILAVITIITSGVFTAFATDCDHSALVNETGVIVVKPTCHSTGSRRVHCSICDKDVFFEIEMTEHQWVWTYNPYPTLTTTGLKNGRCSVCGETIENVEVPKLECGEHNSDLWASSVKWEIIYDSTCLEIGKEQAWCNTCDKYIVRDIPLKEHYKTVFPQINPTCEIAGCTESVYCYNCHTYVVAPVKIPAIGHSLYEDADIEAPTCEKEGKGHIYCAHDGCDFEEKVDIAKLPHTDNDNNGFCDICEARLCKCLCHQNNFIGRFIRILNTVLNKLIHDGEMVFRCCECMEPLELGA